MASFPSDIPYLVALSAGENPKLLVERNVVMAERTTAVAKDRSVFIAVGVSRLAGDNGLIAAFKKAGFKLCSR